MQKTVKQICEEQGILGQIILERWEKHSFDIDSKANSFSKCISDIATLESLGKRLAFDKMYKMIEEIELRPKNLSEQLIEQSGLRQAVENMKVTAEQASQFTEKAKASFENKGVEPQRNIPKFSIVTIDGKEYELQGDAVPVKPITELIQGKRYLIRYSEEFCYSLGKIDRELLKQKQVEVIFVGEIKLSRNTERNIFYSENLQGTYFMFGTKLDYIIKQLD